MHQNYRRNITLSYLLSIFGSGSFWWAIWILYYLLFTDYAGIGVLEMVLVMGSLSMEIPTGALADLLGKKVSLILAYSLVSVGNLIMGVSTGMPLLLVSVAVVALGNSFRSGAFEALIYDSLVGLGEKDKYQKILAHNSSLEAITIAVVSILGGFAYLINPRFPFYLTALFAGFAAISSLFLAEPELKRHKLTLRESLIQSVQGFKHLIHKDLLKYSIIFFLVGIIAVTGFEMVEDILVVEAGFMSHQLGLIYASFGVVAAISAQFVPFLVKKFGNIQMFIFSASVMGISFLITPFAAPIVIVILIITRVIADLYIGNITSAVINEHTPSEDRATTLSTFNMLKNLPFALSAAVLGGLIMKYTVFVIAGAMGVILLLIVLGSSYVLLIKSSRDAVKQL